MELFIWCQLPKLKFAQYGANMKVSLTRFARTFFLGSAFFLSSESKGQSYMTNYYNVNINPRDIAYYPLKKQMLISSQKTGQIGSVDESGNYTLVLSDSTLIASTGLFIRDSFLYVLASDNGSSEKSSDETIGKLSKLYKISLLSNRTVAIYDLARLFKGPRFIKDLTIDHNATIYIIDDLSECIYTITRDESMAVLPIGPFIKNGEQKLNAIAYNPSGFLFVAANNKLFKVALKDNHHMFTKVYLDNDIDEITSLAFTNNNLLILSTGGSPNQVHILNTTNSWLTAKVIRTDSWKYQKVESVAVAEQKIFVLNSFPEAITGTTALPAFYIRVIDLKKRLDEKEYRKTRVTPGKLERRN